MSYKESKYGKKAVRRNYSRMRVSVPLPGLIDIQTQSFEQFVDEGLMKIFNENFPISAHNGDLKLSVIGIDVEKPEYSILESKKLDISYKRKIRVHVELKSTVDGNILTKKDTVIFEMPFMTPSATFIINGAERVVISQVIRSTGVYFTTGRSKVTNTDTLTGQMIPTRGAWAHFECGNKNIFYSKLNKSKKFLLTTFLAALGLKKEDFAKLYNEEMLNPTIEKDDILNSSTPDEDASMEIFKKMRQNVVDSKLGARKYLRERLFDSRRYDLAEVGRYKYNKKLDILSRILGHNMGEDITLNTGEVIKKDTLITKEVIEKLSTSRESFRKLIINAEDSLENLSDKELLVTYDENEPGVLRLKDDILHSKTDEVLREAGTIVDEEFINYLRSNKDILTKKDISFFITSDNLSNILNRKPTYVEMIDVLVKDQYDNTKFNKVRVVGNDSREEKLHATVSDFLAAVSYYFNIEEGVGTIDDIDHLGNRRVRLIGELLESRFRKALLKLEKYIRDNIESQKFEEISLGALLNFKLLSTEINSFFGQDQLSQFMDQINPLAELTQKRRISALGEGGIPRDRAGIDVRDVHPSHYGRICPIETPDGQSIGLISSLATYTLIDKFGFIQTPYLVCDRSKKDENGNVLPRVILPEPGKDVEYKYLTADEEYDVVVASSSEELNDDGTFKNSKVIGRKRGETGVFDVSEVHYMDVSPKQVVSVATATIPFLEHDEASRCQMGANMQRQAVPVIKTESPIVGTGVEYKAAKDSGTIVINNKAKQGGWVVYADAKKIIVLPIPEEEISYDGQVLFRFGEEWTYEQAKQIFKYGLAKLDTYELANFEKSNQDTCIIQKPIVTAGEWVDSGDVLADGPSTSNGELALGRNVTVAFMTWEGYNFEDAVIMSEDLVKKDIYTSIHINKYVAETREVKTVKDKEAFTREFPNADKVASRNLDQDGIVIEGSEVKEGDVLVGKITPKGTNETPSNEHKLISEIIGKKAEEFKDASLRVPHGGNGIVQKVLRFSADKDILPPGVLEQVKVFVVKKRKIREGDKMAGRHGNKGVISKILPREDMPYMEDGTPIDIMLSPLGVPSRMNIGQILEIHLGYAAKKLGVKIASPVFDGVNDEDLVNIMKEANVRLDGKQTLYDGRTGEPFINPISVGVMYMIKLSHMVDDKLHARNVGQYTLVTQQPMGGKAQNGGQRFGEMEVWALYAYGAAYTLQEMLTIKSDDTVGRKIAYRSIVTGRPIPKPNLPESFRVLTHELQALGLYVELINDETGDNDAIKSIVDLNQNKRRFNIGGQK